MKTKYLLLLTTLSFLSTLDPHLSTAQAQDTAFTYQGRLNDGSGPANGVYDLTFQAFDAPSAGNSIGGTANVNGVGVTNGLFTALVDLGSSPFTGPARWLQIRVSTNGAGSFATLTPRQPLTPSPYAIYAHTAGTVTNGAIASTQLAAGSVANGNIQDTAVTAGKIAPGQVVKSLNGLTDAVSLTPGANVTITPVGNSLQISAPAGGLNLPFSGTAASSGSILTLSNSASGAAGAFLGNVGVGTTVPRTRLTVWTPNLSGVREGLRLNNPVGFAGSDNGSALVFSQDRETSENFVNASIQGAQETPNSSANAYLAFSTKSGGLAVAERMRITSGGNVGIGTTTPQARLDVRGDIRLGPSDEFRATGGEENLRIVRGIVSSTGTILRGSGFTVARTFPTGSDGLWTITFTVPFASPPTVCFTADFVDFQLPRIAVADDVNASSAAVRLFVPNGTSVDTPFHFIAIGPR